MLFAFTLWLAAASPLIRALAGVTLGTPALSTIAKHPEAREVHANSGSTWTWRRKEGGSVAIFADVRGTIVKIEFIADQGEQGTIDLPCAAAFDVQGSHVNLQMAIDPRLCTLSGGDVGTYTLADGSILTATFGPGDGQLLKAVWSWPQSSPTAGPVNRVLRARCDLKLRDWEQVRAPQCATRSAPGRAAARLR